MHGSSPADAAHPEHDEESVEHPEPCRKEDMESFLCLFRKWTKICVQKYAEIKLVLYIKNIICCLILQLVRKTCGNRITWAWYGAVSVLSLLMAPDKEAAAIFVFLGYYPIVKGNIESIRRPLIEWVIKLAVFNATMVLAYWLLLQFFHLDPEAFVVFGINMPLVILALGNVAFIVYDRAMTILLTSYLKKLHPRFSKLFRK